MLINPVSYSLLAKFPKSEIHLFTWFVSQKPNEKVSEQEVGAVETLHYTSHICRYKTFEDNINNSVDNISTA